jgi:hypothetical protein
MEVMWSPLKGFQGLTGVSTRFKNLFWSTGLFNAGFALRE